MARLEQEAQEWIEQITGEYFSGSFAESLKDGIILCKCVGEQLAYRPTPNNSRAIATPTNHNPI